MDQRPAPREIGTELLRDRYPGAAVVFVCGSIRRGEATATSDIDLVVLFPNVEHAYRESFLHKGWPVEAFIHDPETLNYFFQDDAKTGVPSLAQMIVEGDAIPASHGLVRTLKTLADRVLAAGPPELEQKELREMRYGLSDLLDDLRAPRDPFEAKALAARLHGHLGNFWFRVRGTWSATGKHVTRRMRKLDPAFAERWTAAFEAAFAGDRGPVIHLTEEILKLSGGYLFEGYRRDAPRDWRRTLPTGDVPTELPAIESGLAPDEKVYRHERGDIHVRLARLEDAPTLSRILNAAYRRLAEEGLNYSASFQDDEQTARGLLQGRTLVIERAGEVIGTMKLMDKNHFDDRPCLYVGRFGVKPELQGQGIGLHLLELAEKIARREGRACLQLDTAQDAKHLAAFYESRGFKIRGLTYFEGKTYLSWVLEKTLT